MEKPSLIQWVDREHKVTAERLDELNIPPMTESELVVSMEQVKVLYTIATVLAHIQEDIHRLATIVGRMERGGGTK